jgi:hypothetical protein
MEIYANNNGVRVDAHRFEDGSFKCFPKGCNLVSNAKRFSEIREAAAFLVQNPEWGIRMNPGTPIIYEGITIVRR